MTAPAPDPWADAETWAARVTWVKLDDEPIALAVVSFEAGYSDHASLVISPGRIGVIGRIPGMSPDQARRLVALLSRGIGMAEHPPAAVDKPVDNEGGQ